MSFTSKRRDIFVAPLFFSGAAPMMGREDFAVGLAADRGQRRGRFFRAGDAH
jgi:hypothetical protein